MFDVALTVDFLMEYANDILVDFRAFAKETPVIYMNDIPVKYKDKLSLCPGDRDYYSILVSKWSNCTQIEKLTVLHFVYDVMDISLLDFRQMVDEMILRVDKCKIEHGTMVGVQAAQSLSEKLQQATLNSFHSSGNKKAAQVGLKRLKEILDASKIPSLVYVGPFVSEKAIDMKTFLPKTLKDFVVSSQMKNTSFECNMSASFEFDFFLRLCSNQTLKNSLSYNKRKQTLTYTLPKRKQKEKGILNGVLKGMMDIHYSGIKGASDVDEDTVFMANRTVPQSGGKTIGQIFNICPDIDLTKLKANDYVFIQETFGIEAARRYLLNEMKDVLSREGISVSIRHLNLIVDNMTYTGEVQANRYSALDIKDSVILKSTFQQATTTFCTAASSTTCDYMKDVSSQIMMGKTPNMGVMYSHIVVPPREKEQQPEPMEDITSPEYAPPSPEYAPLSPGCSPEYHPSSPCGYLDNDSDSVGWEMPVTPEPTPELLSMDLSI